MENWWKIGKPTGSWSFCEFCEYTRKDDEMKVNTADNHSLSSHHLYG